MAKYTIIHKCGCENIVKLFGHWTFRESRVEWLEGQPCLACKKKETKKAALNEQRRTVMKNAWVIARAGAAKFGGPAKLYIKEAMKMAWAEAKKNNVKLKGSAKQISWAEDIRTEKLPQIQKVEEEFHSAFEKKRKEGVIPEDTLRYHLKKVMAVINEVRRDERASFWIDHRNNDFSSIKKISYLSLQ